VGTAVHAVAQQVADGLPPADARAALDTELDRLDLGPGWADQRQRRSAHEMLDRFLDWHVGSPRELVAAEADFDVTIGRVRMRGQVDRLERDGEGRLVVVDLKTGRTAAAGDEIAEHGQLAAYQVAIASGGFAEHGTAAGGAALLQIGGSTSRHCRTMCRRSRPGPGSCWPRSARAWARRPSRCAPAATATAARCAAAVPCTSAARR
jgi:RecB family exonuclease